MNVYTLFPILTSLCRLLIGQEIRRASLLEDTLKGVSITEILYPDLIALRIFFLVFLAAAIHMLRRKVD
jgi:hypothetical protein